MATRRADLLAKVRDIIEVNGVVALVDSVTTEAAANVCTPRRVDVTLSDAVTDGDKISVVTSSHTFGTQSDQRRIAATASTTVQEEPNDIKKPVVTIIGIANEPLFQIRITDDGELASTAAITPDELTLTSGKGTAELGVVTHTAGTSTATVTVIRTASADGLTSANTLAAGDLLTLKSGAIDDASGNVNGLTSGRAISEDKSPYISSVLLSNSHHRVQNTWTLPASVGAIDDNAITVRANASGGAAGAAGNDWSIVIDTPSTYSAAKPLDIDVRVDTKGKKATIRFVNGRASLGDLLAALKANSDFDQRFTATTGCDAVASTALMPSVEPDDRVALADTDRMGRTQFAIEVRFSGFIAEKSDEELLDDVLARTVARNTDIANREALIKLMETAGTGENGYDPGLGAHVPYSKTVRYEMTVSTASHVPLNRDLVASVAGATESADADADLDGDQPRAKVAHVATGYAPDDANTVADESRNGGSQVRVSQSDDIEARD